MADHRDAPAETGDPGSSDIPTPTAPVDQEQLIEEHEAAHGPLPRRILAELRSGGREVKDVGSKAAGVVGESTEALRLEVVSTGFHGPRALVGHALGMRLLIPAEGMHGPRETASLLYLFRDAICIRPTDDSPMSAVPLYGLHIVMPHVALARWLYKAGRTAHANVDLAKDEKGLEGSLGDWTVDNFIQADPKLQALMVSDLSGPVRVYQHLGLVRLAIELANRPVLRLKSALPEPTDAYRRLWDLFAAVVGSGGVTRDPPAGGHDA